MDGPVRNAPIGVPKFVLRRGSPPGVVTKVPQDGFPQVGLPVLLGHVGFPNFVRPRSSPKEVAQWGSPMLFP
jgi:hypothetical protein